MWTRDTQLALTRSTRMAPLSSLVMEVPFRNPELGNTPAERGARTNAAKLCKGRRKLGLGPPASTCPWCLFSLPGAEQLAAVTGAWAGAGLIQGNKTRAQNKACSDKAVVTYGAQQACQSHTESVSSSFPPAVAQEQLTFSRCLGPRGRAG